MEGEIEKWDNVSQLDVQSDTKLEHDGGTGKKAIIRRYEFHANPEAFQSHVPTRQELFNAHAKQIEIQLWGDGLVIMKQVEPRVLINKKKTRYSIFVGAEPRVGLSIFEQAMTLSEIAKNPTKK